MPEQRGAEIEISEFEPSRRLRDLREIASLLRRSKKSPLQICTSIIAGRGLDLKTSEFFCGLQEDERHYWIATLYALLMPRAQRRKLAAYFTPPHLATYAIRTLLNAGVRPGHDRILDPASGGAAFLVPLAALICGQARQRGADGETILRVVESSLAGVEIEGNLAELSKGLLCDLLRKEIAATGRRPKIAIHCGDTLKLTRPDGPYDAAIGNPPYGRVFRPTKKILTDFSAVVTDGHVNLYALFLEQTIRWVKPGGVICLIIPMSFLGGPYFASLRKRILETSHVLQLDPIDKRSDVFVDVFYDVCVLVLRKKGMGISPVVPTSSLLMMGQPNRLLGTPDIPNWATDRIWALPDEKRKGRLFQSGLETIEDYGYNVKTGYFVWNREQERYRTGNTPRQTEVPLFWAHNVKANCMCRPYDGKGNSNRIGFVRIDRESNAIIVSDAIILQRTSNRRQPHRLIAAIVRKDDVPGRRGFVTENHTIVIVPDATKKQQLAMGTLCRLLNTSAVDTRFRRMSGSVSVSTKALRQLPLPAAVHVSAAFDCNLPDDVAAESAYSHSIENRKRESSAKAAGE